MAILAQFFCGRDEGHIFIADASGGDPLITGFPLGLLFPKLSTTSPGILEGSESEAGEALRSLVEPIVEHSAEDEVVWIVPHNICTICRSTHFPRRKASWVFATLSATRPAPPPCLFVVVVQDLMEACHSAEIPQDLRYARLEAERVAETMVNPCWSEGQQSSILRGA